MAVVLVGSATDRTKHEGSFRRAWRTTMRVARSFQFSVVAGVIAVAALVIADDRWPSTRLWKQVLTDGLAAACGPVAAFVVVLLVMLLAAPYLQRNEARRERDSLEASQRPAPILPFDKLRSGIEEEIRVAYKLRADIAAARSKATLYESWRPLIDWQNRVQELIQQSAFRQAWQRMLGSQYLHELEAEVPVVLAWLDARINALERMIADEAVSSLTKHRSSPDDQVAVHLVGEDL